MRLYTFLLSCLMAFIAGHIVNYTIIFLALEWFNSHALAGVGYGLCFGPPLILGWFAGVYCDRYSPRKVLLFGQNSFFISIALLALASQQSMESAVEFKLSLLLTAALFSGIGWSFVAPARFATLPYYVSVKNLASASIILNLMVMTGFGLAPMLLKFIEFHFNWQAVFISAAILFLLSSSLLIPLRFTFTPKTTGTVIKEVANTFRFVKESLFIMPFLVLAIVAHMLMGPMQVLLPSIAKNNLLLSDVAQGNYLSLIALALIIGGVAAMALKDRGNIGKKLLVALFVAGIGVGYLGITHQVSTSIAALLISGACGGIAVSFIVAGLQHFSVAKHRGRIMSFYSIIGQVVPALSGIIAGVFAQLYSPETALQIMAFIIVTSTVFCFIFLHKIRKLQGFSHV